MEQEVYGVLYSLLISILLFNLMYHLQRWGLRDLVLSVICSLSSISGIVYNITLFFAFPRSSNFLILFGISRQPRITKNNVGISDLSLRLLLGFIRKRCLCNIYPTKPHFYIDELGFAGLYLFFSYF